MHVRAYLRRDLPRGGRLRGDRVADLLHAPLDHAAELLVATALAPARALELLLDDRAHGAQVSGVASLEDRVVELLTTVLVIARRDQLLRLAELLLEHRTPRTTGTCCRSRG